MEPASLRPQPHGGEASELPAVEENPTRAQYHAPRLHTCSSPDELCADVAVWGQLSGGSLRVYTPGPALVHLHLPKQQVGASSRHHAKRTAGRVRGSGSCVQYAVQTSVLFVLVPLHALWPFLSALLPHVQETSEVEVQQVFAAQGVFWQRHELSQHQ